jgi:hypothetical protein
MLFVNTVCTVLFVNTVCTVFDVLLIYAFPLYSEFGLRAELV